MQIAEFLETSRDHILSESIAFAKTILRLKEEDEETIRDHLPLVLEAISKDLRTAQSRTESIDKSHGLSATVAGHETPAETHGVLRARSGLTVEQLFAEYRSLRSCVLRLWAESQSHNEDALRDVGRFNEAIDQALAESVRTYAGELERWQQIFLGVLGHDLRGPLNAIALSAELIAAKAPAELGLPTAMLSKSTRRMASLMDSLLQYNMAGLGVGMPLARLPVDLEEVCKEELEMQRAALPGALVELITQGNTQGVFDGSRVREALGNLVTNAVKHGVPREPVIVKIEGDNETVWLSVENATAQAITSNEMEQLFEPLRRGAAKGPESDRSNLGLGLFIVRQIAKVHGGDVHGECFAGRVRFTMTLPKVAPAAPRE
jgi:signal transduction histidine kinase